MTKSWVLIGLSAVCMMCGQHGKKDIVLETSLAGFRERYLPDKRLALLELQVDMAHHPVRISGETNLPEILPPLNELLAEELGDSGYELSLKTLPDQSLGDRTRALVTVSVANLRRKPQHAAELVDQAIMGTPLQLLKREGGWYLVQTPYRYLGWMTESSFLAVTIDEERAWLKRGLIRFNKLAGTVYKEPDFYSIPVADLVLGSTFQEVARTDAWLRILLPGGREGFIPNDQVTGEPAAENMTAEIIARAKRLVGVPYLWGGNSSKGLDCSGFTQTVFKLSGVNLPRDANQQVLEGVAVTYDHRFESVKPGDLLFFGENPERITHVALSLGGAVFIHSEGQVRIDTLDADDPAVYERRLKNLRAIRRLSELP